jgi:hypothetical protein
MLTHSDRHNTADLGLCVLCPSILTHGVRLKRDPVAPGVAPGSRIAKHGVHGADGGVHGWRYPMHVDIGGRARR